MGSRSVTSRPFDYCLHPLKLLKDGEYIIVPCGVCDGCLLHKSNLWSQRVSFEIDHNPFSIFFTLTYDNKYLPTLIPFKTSQEDFIFVSDHPNNIRYNGSCDVLRNDGIVLHSNQFIPIENDDRKYTINYGSKRDIQLWLKLLRKDILSYYPEYETDSKFFRYYIISEYGPRTHRAHFHGILFPKNREIAEILTSSSMFKNWKMCDNFLFNQYVSYCDSGTSTYVSNYLNSCSYLPAVYKNSEIKPFRLSSKSPAIGFSAFDKEKIFEDVSQRIITYTRTINRVEQTFVLQYPSSYMSSLFPKCYGFSLLSFERLLWIYGTIYREVFGYGRPCSMVSKQLSSSVHSSDLQAMNKCYEFCIFLGCTPFHYLYLLDNYYYLTGMQSLSRWYEWQASHMCEPVEILKTYSNFSDYVSNKHSLSSYQLSNIRNFCSQFGIIFDDLDRDSLMLLMKDSSEVQSYKQQVHDVVINLDKSKKINEQINNKPHVI